MSDETIERTFVTSLPARLNLSNIRGKVEILPHADGPTGEPGKEVVTVTAVKHNGLGNSGRTQVIMEQAQDGSLTIETKYNNAFWFNNPCAVDYTVRMPRNSVVKVSGVSNSTSLQGLQGEFTVESVSGTIRIKDLAGPISLHSVSGEILGEGLSGELKFDTVSGKVSLLTSDLATVDGSTVSGSVTLEKLSGGGPYRFNSVSGGLRLSLPDNTGCTVEMESLSGQVKSNLPVTAQWSNGHRHPGGKQHVEINGGGVSVNFSSVSGSLWLDGSGQVNQAPAPLEEPESPTTMEILEKIERGELSVEEGLKKLK